MYRMLKKEEWNKRTANQEFISNITESPRDMSQVSDSEFPLRNKHIYNQENFLKF